MKKILLNRKYKLLELLIIGLLIPTLVLVNRLAENVILILWLITVYGGSIYIKYHNSAKLKEVLNFQAFTKKNINIILIRWMLLTIVIYLITFYFYNDKLFTIQRQHPYFLIVIFFVYPILSALPQEFIFTTFFFSRYADIIPEKLQILTSAIIFTYAHVLFINFIAPFLSLFGGLIFANTYKKTKTTLTPGLENVDFVKNLDASNFIKSSRAFYQSKGTEESFRILFNVLYNETPKVVDLEEYLINPSSAEYIRREILFKSDS